MAHHLLAYTASVTNGVANFDTPGVTDGWASLQNGHYLTPQDSRIVAAIGIGATIQRARVVSPTIRAIILPHIQPLNVGAGVVTPTPFCRYFPGGYKVNSVDELEVDVTQGAGVAEREVVGLWLSDGIMSVPQGDVYTAHLTAAVVNVANLWGSGTMTFEAGLPKGLYSVVGMAVVGANVLLARLIFPTAGRRPGCPGQATFSIVPDMFFRQGNMGEFGQFVHTAPPLLELFGTTPTTTQDVFLDLIKIG
jgi:hypothetical protein